jgi:hypothetical protein
MTQELSKLDTAEIQREMSVEQIAAVWNRLDTMKAAIRQAQDRIEQGMIEWIQQHGPVVIGDVRFYVGPKKATRCTDIAGALNALLVAVAGDVDQLVHVLAAQPFKHGAARDVLAGEFDLYFETTEQPDLKEGKPAKQLQRVDTRFLPKGDAPTHSQHSTGATHETASAANTKGIPT